MHLSSNFSLDEFLRSQVALRLDIDNTPTDEDTANLRLLCQSLLDPVRTILGVPLHIDSGYRSTELNAAVGGAWDSAHLSGRAADVIPIGMSLRDAFDTIRRNTALPIDQCLVECQAWIHLAIAPTGATPRREFLVASGGPGHWIYINA